MYCIFAGSFTIFINGELWFTLEKICMCLILVNLKLLLEILTQHGVSCGLPALIFQ